MDRSLAPGTTLVTGAITRGIPLVICLMLAAALAACGVSNAPPDRGPRDDGGADVRDADVWDADGREEDRPGDARTEPDGPGALDVTLELDPTEVTLVQGTQAEVSITLQRGAGADDELSFSLEGAPAGVKGSFDPPATRGDGGRLTLTVALSAPTGRHALTVRASAGTRSAAAPLTLEVVASDVVAGHVVNVHDEPLQGVPVRLADGRATISDAEGRFRFEGVSRPYHVLVGALAPDAPPVGSEPPLALAYLGLTRADPGLLLLTDMGPTTSTTLTGTVTGVPSPPPDGATLQLLCGGPGVRPRPAAPDETGSFVLTVDWASGEPTRPATLHGLYIDPTGPTPLFAYGQRSLVLEADGALGGQDLVLSEVESAPLDATIAGAAEGLLIGLVDVDPHSQLALPPVPAGQGPPLALPRIAGASYGVVGVGQSKTAVRVQARVGLSGSGEAVALELPPEVVLASPPAGTPTLTPATAVRWNALPGAVYQVRVTAQGQAVLAITSATELTLSELVPLGLELEPGTTLEIAVSAAGPFASIDAAAGGAAVLGASQLALAGRIHTDGFASLAASPRAFTLAAAP